MGRPLAITALPVSPTQDRHRRFVQYTVMMTARVVCFVGAIVVQEWWRYLLVVAALILPYVAVVIANVTGVREHEDPEQPGPPELPGTRHEA